MQEDNTSPLDTQSLIDLDSFELVEVAEPLKAAEKGCLSCG